MLKHAHKPRKIQIGGTIPQTRKWRQSGFRKCDSIYSPQCAARVRVRMCVGPCHIWLHMRICISRDLFVRVPVVTNVQSRDQAFADPATVSERECVLVYRSKCEFPQRLASLELALFFTQTGDQRDNSSRAQYRSYISAVASNSNEKIQNKILQKSVGRPEQPEQGTGKASYSHSRSGKIRL